MNYKVIIININYFLNFIIKINVEHFEEYYLNIIKINFYYFLNHHQINC